MRFGEWKSIQNSFLPVLSSAPVLSKKIAILDAEAIESKKQIERKNHL